jgi:hypothetical protein
LDWRALRALSAVSPAERGSPSGQAAGGVYSYATRKGTRWYFKVRGADGLQTSRRGFSSQRAARDAKRRLTERIERGEMRDTRESFDDYWQRWLALRRPYLVVGAEKVGALVEASDRGLVAEG